MRWTGTGTLETTGSGVVVKEASAVTSAPSQKVQRYSC